MSLNSEVKGESDKDYMAVQSVDKNTKQRQVTGPKD